MGRSGSRGRGTGSTANSFLATPRGGHTPRCAPEAKGRAGARAVRVGGTLGSGGVKLPHKSEGKRRAPQTVGPPKMDARVGRANKWEREYRRDVTVGKVSSVIVHSMLASIETVCLKFRQINLT